MVTCELLYLLWPEDVFLSGPLREVCLALEEVSAVLYIAPAPLMR